METVASYYLVGIIIICLITIAGLVSDRNYNKYLPRNLLKGSDRANNMLTEVDSTLLFLLGFLRKSYPSVKDPIFFIAKIGLCTWKLTYDGNKEKYNFVCRMDDMIVYTFGQGRNNYPSLEKTIIVYRSIPGLIKKMVRTFPWLQGDLKLILEASKL